MAYTPMYPYNEDVGVGPEDIGKPMPLDIRPLASLSERPAFRSRRDRERAGQAAAERGRDASSTKPLGHWTQAVAQVLEGGLAGHEEGQLAKEDAARREYLVAALEGDTSPQDLMEQGAMYDVPEISDIGKFRSEQDWRKQQAETSEAWKQKDYQLDVDKFGYEKSKADKPGLHELEDGTVVDDYGNIVDIARDPNAPGPKAKIGDVLKVNDDIRQLPAAKALSFSIPVYNSMMKAADNTAGDMQIINAYAKILDPTSVVMTGEEERIREGANLPAEIYSWVAYVKGGSRLGKDLVANLKAEAKTRVIAQQQAFDAAMKQYNNEKGGLLQQYNIRPEDVTPQFPGLYDPEAEFGD